MSTSRVPGTGGLSPKHVYLVFFAQCVALLFSSGEPQLLWRLWFISAAPVSTTGVVTVVDCQNHRVDYAFTVDGFPQNAPRANIGGLGCKDLRVGQRIAVYFERGEPENNYALRLSDTAGHPIRNEFFIGLSVICVFVLLAPLFLSALWFASLRWKARPR